MYSVFCEHYHVQHHHVIHSFISFKSFGTFWFYLLIRDDDEVGLRLRNGKWRTGSGMLSLPPAVCSVVVDCAAGTRHGKRSERLKWLGSRCCWICGQLERVNRSSLPPDKPPRCEDLVEGAQVKTQEDKSPKSIEPLRNPSGFVKPSGLQY